MADLKQAIQDFMNDLALDVAEERMVEYVIREVHGGRKLAEVLNDPYIRNRLNSEKVAHVLANPEIAAAIEQQIAGAFKTRDFGFAD